MHRRRMLEGFAALGVSSIAAHAARKGYDAVVAKRGGYPTISDAVRAATGTRPFRIFVDRGVWRERVDIAKPFVQLVGAGRDATTIVFDRSAGDKGPDGAPIGTFRTATVFVRAPDFRAEHLTFANDFDYVAHLPKPVPQDKTGNSGAQAVALAVQDGADRTFLHDVRITGFQDTLFLDAGRSLLRGCKVEGCVDFIFGAGRAVLEDCEIVSRLRPGQDFNGYICAPDTDIHQPFGFVFDRCRLVKAPGMAPRTVALGRAWRRTGTFADGHYGDPQAVGAAAFAHCWMDDHIVPEGWYPMGYNLKSGGRAMLEPEEARLFEYHSTGPGAGPASAHRRFLTDVEARSFTTANVLDGWTS